MRGGQMSRRHERRKSQAPAKQVPNTITPNTEYERNKSRQREEPQAQAARAAKTKRDEPQAQASKVGTPCVKACQLHNTLPRPQFFRCAQPSPIHL